VVILRELEWLENDLELIKAERQIDERASFPEISR
jgi:hypothetical protein